MIGQRTQYAKGHLTRAYWDYRDRVALDHIKGPHILDVGCGEGITLAKLIALFPVAEVLGVDLDPRNIEICQEHQLPVQQASVYELPFGEESFDTCILMEVIEHLEQPEKAIAELARVTRPGGRIIVVYPVDWAMHLARMLCLKFVEARFDPGHLRQWNVSAIKRLMRNYSYQPSIVRQLPLFWPFMLHGLVVGEMTGHPEGAIHA